MRPKKFDFDPSDANLIGFLSNATGATWTLTANDSGDSLAHKVSVLNDTVNDHSAKTAILTGTDADGKAQTETISLPAGSATVQSTKYFLTLTSVVPSATIGADTMDIGWVDEFASKTIVLNHYAERPPTVQVLVTGTINFDFETTLENPLKRIGGTNAEDGAPFSFTGQNDLAWLNDANFTAKTASLLSPLAAIGLRGMRIVVNSYTNTAEMQVWMTHPD